MNASFDFTKSFPLSDVVLVAEDAEGNKRELHANRAYIATYSPFFERMFFSDFKEVYLLISLKPVQSNADLVELSCSYEAMKLILEAIYRNTRDYSEVKLVYDIDVLMELYKAADYLDISFIRGLCVSQMMDRPSDEMATAVLGLVASGLHLHDTLMEIINRMIASVIMNFLAVDNSHLVFSKDDVTMIYKAIAKKSLPEAAPREYFFPSIIPDLNEEYENLYFDCKMKFPWSDVLIKTKNSDGKELYSSKAVLATVSPHFAKMFYDQPESPNTGVVEIELDVEYLIMKNILSIIHHCYKHASLQPTATLYTMFCIASEDRLNIPNIRELCSQRLIEIAKNPTINQVEASTKMINSKSAILKMIDAKELLGWVHTSGIETNDVYVFEENGYKVHFSNKKKPILSLNDVRIIVEKLLKEYNK